MLLLILVNTSLAQRVEFPTPAQPVQYGVSAAPPTYAAPAPPPNYSLPATTPPTLSAPLPTYSAPSLGPPPTFDPYAVGGTTTPAPPAAPFAAPAVPTYPATAPPTYTPATPFTPYPTTAAPPIQPTPNPFQYQQPAPYDLSMSGETYWAKTQRFLQELSFEYTYLYGSHTNSNQFGLDRVELSSTLAFPMFNNIETPLLVTPGFAFNWLDGPESGPPIPGPPPLAGGPDLPPRVYDAYLDFAWFPRFSPALGAELGFRTGVYSDFDHVNSDSVRFMGRGAADIAIAPDMDLVAGAVYLDRVDVKILPVIGIYYRPTPDWDIYAVFPNPKIRRFLATVGTTKWYGYAAGEYGGGSWTVSRETTADRIDYNDIRVIGGLEWETQTQIRGHLEIGYVFDREIVFDSGDPPNFKPNDTIMLRAGVDF